MDQSKRINEQDDGVEEGAADSLGYGELGTADGPEESELVLEKQSEDEKPKKKKRVSPLTEVLAYLKLDQVKFENGMIKRKGAFISSDDLVREYYLDLKKKHHRLSKADIHDVIVHEQYKFKSECLKQFRAGLKFRESNQLTEQWLRAVVGESPRFQIYLAVMQHFLWQVKRKVFDLPVEHHLMPIITGKQGSGKSTAIFKMIEPIAEYSVTLDVSSATDSREHFNFHKNFVCFFDELARAQNADVNSLKKLISAPKITYRILSRHENGEAPNTCTFIGATNGRIEDMIYDPTGMRRFFEIPGMEKLDWPIINSMEYARLWQSIDEAQPSPILPFLDQIREIQEEIRALDSVEEWICEKGITFVSGDTLVIGESSKAPQELYRNYAEWLETQKRKPVSQKKFSLRIQEQGAVQSRSQSGQRIYRFTDKIQRTEKEKSDEAFLLTIGVPESV